MRNTTKEFDVMVKLPQEHLQALKCSKIPKFMNLWIRVSNPNFWKFWKIEWGSGFCGNKGWICGLEMEEIWIWWVIWGEKKEKCGFETVKVAENGEEQGICFRGERKWKEESEENLGEFVVYSGKQHGTSALALFRCGSTYTRKSILKGGRMFFTCDSVKVRARPTRNASF